MADKIIVECPSCKVRFFVTQDLLLVANGALRCGFCQHVFNGIKNIKSAAKQEPSKNTTSVDDRSISIQPETVQMTEVESSHDDIETRLANIDAKDNDEYWQKIATGFSDIVGTKKDESDKQQSVSEQNKIDQPSSSSSSAAVDDDILDYLDSIDFDTILQSKEQVFAKNDSIQSRKDSALAHERRCPSSIPEPVNNKFDSHNFASESTDTILDSLLTEPTKNQAGVGHKDGLMDELIQDKLFASTSINQSKKLDNSVADDDAILNAVIKQSIKPSHPITNAAEQITRINSNANVNNTAKIQSQLIDEKHVDSNSSLESNIKKKPFLHSEVDAKAALNKLRNANIKSKKELNSLSDTDQSIKVTIGANNDVVQQAIKSDLTHQDSQFLDSKNQSISSLSIEQQSKITDQKDVSIKPTHFEAVESPTVKKVLIGSDKPIEFKPSSKFLPSISNISKSDMTTPEVSSESSSNATSKDEHSKKGNVLPGIDDIKESMSDSSKPKIELVPIEIPSTTDDDHPSLHTQLSAIQYADRLENNASVSSTGSHTENTSAGGAESLTHKLASILKKKMKH